MKADAVRSFFAGFGKEKAPLAGGAVTIERKDMRMNLLDSTRADKPADAAPLFAASTSDRRRAQALFDSWLSRAKRGGVFSEKVKVTPALAEIMLEHNPSNRRISVTGLRRYKADMTEGRFAFNGETIKIGASGQLLDGQHRCRASVETGVSFETLVVVGLATTARETVDQGVRRISGHQLHMLGYKDASNLGHASRVFWQLNRFGCVSSSPEKMPTWPQIQETVEENPGLADTAFGHRAYKAKLGGVGLHTALREWLGRASRDAEKFYEHLVTGLDLRGKTNPIYVLRKSLIERDRLTEAERAAFVIKGWNAWREGTPLRVLKFLPGEEFPKAE